MTYQSIPEVRQWSVARDPRHPERNEDALRVEIEPRSNGWNAFLVLSDGAGSTLFAGDWARALVGAAEAEWVANGLTAGVQRVRSDFDPLATANASDFMRVQKWRNQGSAATFVAAVVESDAFGTTCRVISVGDSLAIVSGPDALTSFPLTSSSQFSNRTETVGTHRRNFKRGNWRPELPAGSMLVLASDAIGRWLLIRYEQSGAPSVHTWLRDATSHDLPSLDDDVTLIVLELPQTQAKPSQLDKMVRLSRLRQWWAQVS